VKPLIVAASIITLALLPGCAAVEQLSRDPRDAPWDPRPGQGTLFTQIPSWDDEAHRRCGSRLPRAERQRLGLSDRC
jgi:hypothetical protein